MSVTLVLGQHRLSCTHTCKRISHTRTTSRTSRTSRTRCKAYHAGVAASRGVPPLVRTTSSVLTTFPIFYAICMKNHRIIVGNVVKGSVTWPSVWCACQSAALFILTVSVRRLMFDTMACLHSRCCFGVWRLALGVWCVLHHQGMITYELVYDALHPEGDD